MEFPAEVVFLLLRRFLEHHLVCVAVSAVGGVDVSEGGGDFHLPRSNYGTTNVYHSILRLWAVPVLVAKLSSQGECTVFPPFSLRDTPSLSPAYVGPSSAKYESDMRL